MKSTAVCRVGWQLYSLHSCAQLMVGAHTLYKSQFVYYLTHLLYKINHLYDVSKLPATYPMQVYAIFTSNTTTTTVTQARKYWRQAAHTRPVRSSNMVHAESAQAVPQQYETLF